MTPENDTKLCETYPKIFSDARADPKSCMSYGFECQDGWLTLIDSLCAKIQKHCDETGCEQVVARQVKEKFGGLRFYHSGGDDSVMRMIDEAEQESFRVCEMCGAAGSTKPSKRGWIRTMCDQCQNG